MSSIDQVLMQFEKSHQPQLVDGSYPAYKSGPRVPTQKSHQPQLVGFPNLHQYARDYPRGLGVDQVPHEKKTLPDLHAYVAVVCLSSGRSNGKVHGRS